MWVWLCVFIIFCCSYSGDPLDQGYFPVGESLNILKKKKKISSQIIFNDNRQAGRLWAQYFAKGWIVVHLRIIDRVRKEKKRGGGVNSPLLTIYLIQAFLHVPVAPEGSLWKRTLQGKRTLCSRCRLEGLGTFSGKLTTFASRHENVLLSASLQKKKALRLAITMVVSDFAPKTEQGD